MQTIVILVSLAVQCCGSYPSYFTDLLKIISRDNPIQSNQTSDPSEETLDYDPPENPNLNQTIFCPMTRMRQHKAERAYPSAYPWLARVFHSPTNFHPFLCTAAAIQAQIFITAGTCIATAKCGFTSVVHQDIRLGCLALVFANKQSKQWFDDLGLIVTKHDEGSFSKDTVAPLVPWNRTEAEDGFSFLDSWAVKGPTNTVVGYLASERDPLNGRQRLYVLRKAYVSNHLCSKITRMENHTADYYVPCYHSCTPQQHFAASPVCEPYMAGLGHIVLDKTNSILGIATWACDAGEFSSRDQKPSPVGLAVVNSPIYQSQFECALWVTADPDSHDGFGDNFYCP